MYSAQRWGRVDADGTVWVKLADGERAVGSYPGASEDDALAYFARKYDDLAANVSLLEQRIAAQQVSPAEARSTITRLTESVREANAVGDLQALLDRLAQLEPTLEQLEAKADEQRRAEREASLAQRQALVEEAEKLAAVDAEQLPWKPTGDRLRELFDQWRTMQRDHRLEKSVEDELWHRFSAARTLFDRKRRQYFSALDERRAEAKRAKEAIVAEANELRSTTDFASGSARFRDLMTQWKASGRAGRRDDDSLWEQFKAAQDEFFAARNAAQAQENATFTENLAVKEALLTEAEALLPVSAADARSARSRLRDIQDRWDQAGKVPRSDLSRIEGRLRAVEQAVRDAEQATWTRSNPQARARAQDAVQQLESALADLRTQHEKALAAGNTKRADELAASIEARSQWLEQARGTLQEFGG